MVAQMRTLRFVQTKTSFILYIKLIVCLHFYYWSVRSKSVIFPIAADVKFGHYSFDGRSDENTPICTNEDSDIKWIVKTFFSPEPAVEMLE
jgi:hypothetical protein